MQNLQNLKLSLIQSDMLLEPRAEFRDDWVGEYALDMENGAAFPPIVVFFDGTSYWLADGFHRRFAREDAGFEDITADVREGSRRDALRYSLSANAQHGHRRTNEDKRRAVDIMFADPEWAQLSDHEIARVCQVTQPFVSRHRPKPATDDVAEAETDNDYPGPDQEQSDVDLQQGTYPDGVEARDSGVAYASLQQGDEAEERDLEAEYIRGRVMYHIQNMADLPPPETVIDALMKSDIPGVSVQTLERAQAWLERFVALYRHHTPQRWERVKKEAAGGG